MSMDGVGGGGWCLTAAFMSYIGPFMSNCRENMVSKVWIAEQCDFINGSWEHKLCKYFCFNLDTT